MSTVKVKPKKRLTIIKSYSLQERRQRMLARAVTELLRLGHKRLAAEVDEVLVQEIMRFKSEQLIVPITRYCCREFGIPVEKINEENRHIHYVHCRMMIAWAFRELLKMTFKDIGTLLGNRNHATIINCYRKAMDAQALYQDEKQRYRKLKGYVSRLILHNQELN